MKAELNSAMITLGEQFVMTIGVLKRQMFYAGNLDMPNLVHQACVLCYDYVQLCAGAIAYANSRFGPSDKGIYLDYVSCSGQENAIMNCSHSEIGVHNCDHNSEVGVRCLGTYTSGTHLVYTTLLYVLCIYSSWELHTW